MLCIRLGIAKNPSSSRIWPTGKGQGGQISWKTMTVSAEVLLSNKYFAYVHLKWIFLSRQQRACVLFKAIGFFLDNYDSKDLAKMKVHICFLPQNLENVGALTLSSGIHCMIIFRLKRRKPLPGTDSPVLALCSALPQGAALAVYSLLTYYTGSWPTAAPLSVG